MVLCFVYVPYCGDRITDSLRLEKVSRTIYSNHPTATNVTH